MGVAKPIQASICVRVYQITFSVHVDRPIRVSIYVHIHWNTISIHIDRPILVPICARVRQIPISIHAGVGNGLNIAISIRVGAFILV